jgi:hypothetical protein
MAGFWLDRISSTSFSTASAAGADLWYKLPELWAGIPVSCSMTSTGNATNTGPAGGWWAILKARRIRGAISSALWGSALHFVTGAAMATRS